jgi:hypothetical protein
MAAPMRTIHSACECQAVLFATLDDRCLVHESWAVRGTREQAAAYSVNPETAPFDVVWSCPFCGRNSLRTFHPAALPPPTGAGALGS